MAVIFTEHFDGTNGTTISTANTAYTGGATATNATETFDTSTSATGTASGKCLQSTNVGTVVLKSPLFTSTSTLYRRWCSRFSAMPNGNFYISELLVGGATVVGRVAVNSAGKVFIQDGTTTISTGTVALSATTWYRIEWDVVGTSSIVRVYAGPSSLTLVDTITATIAGTAFTQVADGIVAGANSVAITHWIDEAVNDTAATPGPVPIAASSTGSIAFSGSDAPLGVAASTGSLAFTGSDAPVGVAASAGALTFTGSGAPVAISASSGALSLSGSAAVTVQAASSGSISLSGTVSGRGQALSSGSVAFTGTSAARGQASSAGSLGLSGSDTARGSAAASGGLTLTGNSAGAAAATAVGVIGFTGTSTPIIPPRGALDLAGFVTMVDTDATATVVEGF